VHDEYHKRMEHEFLKVDNDDRSLCSISGKFLQHEEVAEEVDDCFDDSTEELPMTSSYYYETRYKYYFLEAMKKNLAKKDQFYFVPSLLSVSIPINSPGYIFSMLLTFCGLTFTFLSWL